MVARFVPLAVFFAFVKRIEKNLDSIHAQNKKEQAASSPIDALF